MRFTRRIGAILLLVVSLGVALRGGSPHETSSSANEPAACRSILLWESYAFDEPLHARHSTILLGVEDLTGNGVLDIAAAVAEGVWIFAGDREGGFALSQKIPLTDREPMAADPLPHLEVSAGCLGDLDGDGSIDILVGGELRNSPGSSRSVLLVLDPVEGEYTSVREHAVSGTPRKVAIEHHGDGEASILLSNLTAAGEEVQRLLLASNEVTGEHVPLALESRWYVRTFADLNGDGYLDAVLSHMKQGVKALLWNDGSREFESQRVTPARGISAITQTDVDTDDPGRLVGCGTIGIVPIPGPGPTDEASLVVYDPGVSVREIRIEDFSGDGLSDIIAVADRGQRLLFIPGIGNGDLGVPQTFVPTMPAGWIGEALMVRDLDADGAPDLVLCVIDGFRVLMNGGNDPYGVTQLAFGGDKLLGTGDLDQDGDVDVIAQGHEGIDVLWNRDSILERESEVFPLNGCWCPTAQVAEGKVYALSVMPSSTRLPDVTLLSVFSSSGVNVSGCTIGDDVLPLFAVGDLNQDGELDAFGTSSGRLWVAWGGIDLAAYDIGPNPSLVVTADNERGGQDAIAVVTGEYADIVRVSFRERQAEISSPLLSLLSVPLAMGTIDWDTDGLRDAVFVAPTFGVVEAEGEEVVGIVGAEWGIVARNDAESYVLQGYPDGEMITPFVPPVIADLEGDGTRRLAYTTTSGEGVYIHDLTDTSRPLERIEKGIGPLYAADLDGNGIDELIGSTLGMFPVVWIQWNGASR